MLSFTLKHLEASHIAARLGQLAVRGRQPISTPHYVVPTSRGIVPHISHDTMRKHTDISAAYIAIEDFIERSPQDAPIFKTLVEPGNSPLRRYIALSDECVSILGPRRVPSIPCPAPNTNSSISISTSVGFRKLESEVYIDACQRLKADLAISLVDLVSADQASVKRIAKSADRTHAWLRDIVGPADEEKARSSPLFASLLPIEKEQQSHYLADLADEFEARLSGLSLQDPSTVEAIPIELHKLPRLCLSNPDSPHTILRAVASGIDLITVPFVTKTSEQGIAFSFDFPAPSFSASKPLAYDLWSFDHATSLEPLTPGCDCYTCTRHHRAYVHHLLQAKEMLAWTLLQIHNFKILERFFARIRQSIDRGEFEQDAQTFHRGYLSRMPEQTGQGPRVRGYQIKSVGGGEPRKNPKAYGRLDDQVQKSAEAREGVAMPDVAAEELEAQGFADKAPS